MGEVRPGRATLIRWDIDLTTNMVSPRHMARYNDIVEGSTVLLPVFVTVPLYVGHAHASQGNGEGLGNGIQLRWTCVRLTVRARNSKPSSNPRLIKDGYVGSITSQPERRSNRDIGVRAANSYMLQRRQKDVL